MQRVRFPILLQNPGSVKNRMESFKISAYIQKCRKIERKSIYLNFFLEINQAILLSKKGVEVYLSEIEIEGYKIFKEKFTVKFNDGLTVLIGENGCGKSAIIDSIRVLLSEDEFGRVGIGESDFHRELTKESKEKGVDKIRIKGIFSNLNEIEQVAYLPWLDYEDNQKAYLNIEIENKENIYGRFKWQKWGGKARKGIFEKELVEAISCIYLPPLRNAPEKLQAYKGSRLARLIQNFTKNDESSKSNIEQKANKFNRELLKDDKLQEIDQIIKDKIIDAVGAFFGQDSMIQFTEVNFNRIVEKLKLLFYPDLSLRKSHLKDKDKMFRELNENSLGYNNILYLATVLAEIEGLPEKETFAKILLIEEPEAHLHPQLQAKLLQYLKEQAKIQNIQIIVTTHSPTIVASCGLDSLKVITIANSKRHPEYCELSKCGLTLKAKFFLERWLDITKSTLFFARGVLFVEGIAEALVIPELAKIVIKKYSEEFQYDKKPESLQDFGISVINMNGIYFDYFMQPFIGSNKDGEINKINLLCAGITDNDPDKDSLPTPSKTVDGKNRCLNMIKELEEKTDNCRLFSNLKTFEYDLAFEENNLQEMSKILLETFRTDGELKNKCNELSEKDWSKASEDEKAEAVQWILVRLEASNPIGKGEFAQLLAYKLNKNEISLSVPKYIENAVKWVIGIK